MGNLVHSVEHQSPPTLPCELPSAPLRQGAGTGSDGADASRVTLLTEVDFKWLMAGQGWHVDAARFQRDTAYAEKLLQLALESSCAALCNCAAKIIEETATPGQIIQL